MSVESQVAILEPSWSSLQSLVQSARESLLVCSPYVSAAGINHLFDMLSGPLHLEVVTRLSPSDWASGVSDPEALVALLRLLESDGWPLSLWVDQRLHAKVYIADRASCLVGSANLTEGGFGRNFELVVAGSAGLGAQAEGLIRARLVNSGKLIAIASLEHWVSSNASVVSASAMRADEADYLAEVQRALDAMLGMNGSAPLFLGEPKLGLADFVVWLQGQRQLRGAQEVLDRHAGKHNLQGHVKQTFVASVLFLDRNADLVDACSAALAANFPGDVPDLSSEVMRRWIEFVDGNASYRGELGDFAILRGYLPPSLGGTVTTGGGGGSTLKRMLPLVANFTQSRGVSRVDDIP